MLMLGFTMEQVVACTTNHAARIFSDFRSAGTLKPGAPADIAILELRDGAFDFTDVDQAKRTGKQKLFATATVLAGKLAVRA
jgi:dihydroorotase